MLNQENVKLVAEAIQNARDNGNEPDSMSAEELAIDLWMSSDCEDIPEDERLEIVKYLHAQAK